MPLKSKMSASRAGKPKNVVCNKETPLKDLESTVEEQVIGSPFLSDFNERDLDVEQMFMDTPDEEEKPAKKKPRKSFQNLSDKW